MKTKIKYIALTFFALVFAACSTSELQKQQAEYQSTNDQKLNQIIGMLNTQQRDDYLTQLDQKIHQYQNRVSELGHRAVQTKGAEASLNWNYAKELQDRVAVLQKDEKELRTAPTENWASYRPTIEADISKAEDAYNQTKLVATAK